MSAKEAYRIGLLRQKIAVVDRDPSDMPHLLQADLRAAGIPGSLRAVDDFSFLELPEGVDARDVRRKVKAFMASRIPVKWVDPPSIEDRLEAIEEALGL